MFYNKLNIVYLGLQDQHANVILNVKAVVVLVQVSFFHTDTFLEWTLYERDQFLALQVL